MKRRKHSETSRGMAVIFVAFLTLVAFIGAVWVNNTFHPAGGNIMPIITLGIGLVAMIVAALE